MVTTQCHWVRYLTRAFCPAIVFLLSFGQVVFATDPEALRVETDVFADRDDVPIAHSLTLFSSKVAWDFLDTTPAEKKTSDSESDQPKAFNGEIVLHDPTRERVLLIDPLRQVKTSIDSIQLERLRVSLAKWARTSDDKLLCWAGGPHFENGMHESDDAIELVGPRVQYRIETTDAPSPEIAGQYRQFADTALLLRALLHPGGIPPFPRLALNKRLSSEVKLPTSVTLEIDSRGSLVPSGLSSMMQRHLCSVHRIHPALRADDLQRIADAEACMAIAEEVSLAEYTQAEKK
ncbi:MAG: hypothetical protein EVA78_06985 [Phycisphaeraceae bacterium]|nr:MAG: hypothetical protein EVA78_06985 [Phycisphaeraceae bacterium]